MAFLLREVEEGELPISFALPPHRTSSQSTFLVPFRRSYKRNFYKNVIYQLDVETGQPRSHAVPITFSANKWPTPSNSDKNFVFFDANGTADGQHRGMKSNRIMALAITLIRPHRVYEVNLEDGRMKLVASSSTELGFKDPIGLSAGPVRLENGKLLIAGHIRRGAWEAPTRMTFFYECDAEAPFTIRRRTPVINFGWSRNVEYCNHIEREGDNLYVSLGVADCGSVLLRLPLESITKLLKPVASFVKPR